jgi:hypothetical protein
MMLALDVSSYSHDAVLLSLGVNYFFDSVLRLNLVHAWTHSTDRF